jgi:serine protease Do
MKVSADTPGGAKRMAVLFALVLLLAPAPDARAQTPAPGTPPGPGSSALDQFSTAVETMVQRVSPAVVQILATRYGLVEDSGRTNMSAGVEQSVGSGAIVSPDGFVITNAHVVQNAYDIRIRLVPRGKQTIGDVLSQSFAPTLAAALVGTYRDGDVALLKIAGDNLPSLPFAGPDRLRQGQVAFAFGSPNGLQNSVTMGVVSSIARQLHPDDPLLYIQTDTPINPGNSGGPLVDTSGTMLGLNTFISTQSGGSEGMGFAIPAGLVQWVYEQLKKYGHVHRPTIGAGLQTITPPLAEALKLSRSSGVIVSDLPSDSPAAAAGLKLNDILLTVNGRAMDNVAAWIGSSFQYVPGSPMLVEVMRGTTKLSLSIVPLDLEEPSERLADLAGFSRSQVTQLGIMAVTFDDQAAAVIGPVRLESGAVVMARLPTTNGARVDLRPGDLIHEVNGKSVFSVEDLKTALSGVRSGDAVALLVERDGQLSYLAFNLP